MDRYGENGPGNGFDGFEPGFRPDLSDPPPDTEPQHHDVFYSKGLADARALVRDSRTAAYAIILYVAVASAISTLLSLAVMFRPDGAFAIVWNKPVVQYSVEILFSVFGVAMPFFLVYIIGNRRALDLTSGSFRRPKKSSAPLTLVLSGIGLCLLANTITTYAEYFFEKFTGVEIPYPDVAVPSGGVFGHFMFLMSLAIIPALTEELIFRGLILQSLRRYGDVFAIMVSSVLFGLVHCNFSQLPFAILAGMVLGYAAAASDSIYPGMIIHCFNNSLSVVSTIITARYGEESKQAFALSIALIVIVAGGSLLAIFRFPRVRRDIAPYGTEYDYRTFGLRQDVRTFMHLPGAYKIFFANVPMVIAIVMIIVRTVMYS